MSLFGRRLQARRRSSQRLRASCEALGAEIDLVAFGSIQYQSAAVLADHDLIKLLRVYQERKIAAFFRSDRRMVDLTLVADLGSAV